MNDDCRVIGHALLEYVYGDLDEIQRKRVDRHLSECPRCSEDLRGYRDTLSLIDESTLEPSEDLSAHFSSVVLAILRRRSANRRFAVGQSLAAACVGLFVMANTLHFSLEGLPKFQPTSVQSVVPAQVAELDDPLLEELALRNLAAATQLKRTL